MKRIAVVVMASALVSGCSSLNESLNGALGGGSSDEAAEVEVIEISDAESVSAGSATQDEAVQGEQVAFADGMQEAEAPMAAASDNGLNAPTQRLFFFGFDSSAVSPEDLAVVQSHAAYLINNPVMIVRLEGHADERGSREYNLALGERRAQTLSDLLVAEGVNSGQIEIISYGEEKPLEMGHEEAFWAQNRRVELTYPQ